MGGVLESLGQHQYNQPHIRRMCGILRMLKDNFLILIIHGECLENAFSVLIKCAEARYIWVVQLVVRG